MPFNIAISGISAATSDLRVIGNNISNAGTIGFKSSRAEFADVYATSVFGTASTATGSGVHLTDVAQQFTQGNVTFTNNNLDLAINGQGFFRMNDGGTVVYTRAGAFRTDRDGYLVNAQQQRLTGFLANGNGQITGQLGDLKLDLSNIEPAATQRVDGALNLDATEVPPTLPWAGPYNFGDPPPDPATYNSATSLTIYDSLGNAHGLSLYFVKTGANTWDVHALVDGVTVGATPAGSLTFNDDGSIDPATSLINITGWTPLDTDGNPNGAAVQDFDVSLLETTQFGSPFAVNALSQDGYATGQLASVEIDGSGIIFGRYTNGQSKALGQVALANFPNPGGLQPLGDTAWAETYSSGQPLVGAPGSGRLGVVQSGALEESNVELTQEMVKLITAQRNFQANAQTIRTADAVTQTIINIR